MKEYHLIENYLIKFLKNRVYSTGLKNAVVGLSGGVDSAVVAVLAQKAFGEDFLAVMLPSASSSQSSISDAQELCKKFDIKHRSIFIGDLIQNYFKDKQASRLRVGNFAARVRMSALYDVSAENSGLVIGTSNKSEILLGYGTIFGDLACALNPIGDMYKTEVFEFAKYLEIPDAIIEKPPTADLWEGQSDEKDLGFSYVELDTVLRAFTDEETNKKKLLEEGFNSELVELVISRIYKNQFKRELPAIAKL